MEYSEWWGFYEPTPPPPLVEQIAHLIPFNCSRKMCPRTTPTDCRTMYGTGDPLSLKKVETFGLQGEETPTQEERLCTATFIALQ